MRAEFEHILRFWFDRGIAGFRIDVAHALIKDELLRDDPPRPGGDGVLNVYSMNRPETHEILRSWRRLAGSYEPERLLLGEAYVLEPDAWASFYGTDGDELQLAFNFGLLHADFDAGSLRAAVAAAEAALPAGAWPCWAGSNHDAGRLTTRWCRGDERLARCALLVLLGLRGTPVLYYGDELALANGHVPKDRELDCATPSRDPGRTPMPWTRGAAAGPIRGSRSTTRAGTSRSSVPIRSRRCISPATWSRCGDGCPSSPSATTRSSRRLPARGRGGAVTASRSR